MGRKICQNGCKGPLWCQIILIVLKNILKGIGKEKNKFSMMTLTFDLDLNIKVKGQGNECKWSHVFIFVNVKAVGLYNDIGNFQGQ